MKVTENIVINQKGEKVLYINFENSKITTTHKTKTKRVNKLKKEKGKFQKNIDKSTKIVYTHQVQQRAVVGYMFKLLLFPYRKYLFVCIFCQNVNVHTREYRLYNGMDPQ